MRPRERLASRGEQYLTDAELLAILLGSGTPDLSALDLALELLTKNGGLRFLNEMSFQELQGIKGIGMAKAARLKAAVELGKRLSQTGGYKFPIRTPEDVKRLVMEEMRFLDREHFRCLYLDRKNRLLAMETVAIGGLSSSMVHPREVFKPAIKRSAASVILVHNHPSGDPSPSQEDIETTKRMVEAGMILGIEVLDHIIIGDGTQVSLKAQKII